MRIPRHLNVGAKERGFTTTAISKGHGRTSSQSAPTIHSFCQSNGAMHIYDPIAMCQASQNRAAKTSDHWEQAAARGSMRADVANVLQGDCTSNASTHRRS